MCLCGERERYTRWIDQSARKPVCPVERREPAGRHRGSNTSEEEEEEEEEEVRQRMRQKELESFYWCC